MTEAERKEVGVNPFINLPGGPEVGLSYERVGKTFLDEFDHWLEKEDPADLPAAGDTEARALYAFEMFCEGQDTLLQALGLD